MVRLYALCRRHFGVLSVLHKVMATAILVIQQMSTHRKPPPSNSSQDPFPFLYFPHTTRMTEPRNLPSLMPLPSPPKIALRALSIIREPAAGWGLTCGSRTGLLSIVPARRKLRIVAGEHLSPRQPAPGRERRLVARQHQQPRLARAPAALGPVVPVGLGVRRLAPPVALAQRRCRGRARWTESSEQAEPAPTARCGGGCRSCQERQQAEQAARGD